eukprot:278070_1
MGALFTGRNNPTNPTIEQKDATKEINIIIPTTAVKLQMHYVLTNWIRELKITTFPDEIMTLIVDKFTFQNHYATQHTIKLQRQKQNMPLKGNNYPKRAKNNSGYCSDYDYLFKILVIGQSGVGKTCLCYRYCDFTFGPQYISNIGIDFRIRTLEVENKQCKLQIWDTAGQERFRTITRSYYRGVTGILLIYDVTDKDSFKHIRYWNKQIEQHKSNYVHKILIGNKIDIFSTHGVLAEDAERLCEELNIPIFMETSAKTGENVEHAFYQLTKQIYEFQKEIDEKQLLQPFRDFKSM